MNITVLHPFLVPNSFLQNEFICTKFMFCWKPWPHKGCKKEVRHCNWDDISIKSTSNFVTVHAHCKKLEVILIQEVSSQLQCPTSFPLCSQGFQQNINLVICNKKCLQKPGSRFIFLHTLLQITVRVLWPQLLNPRPDNAWMHYYFRKALFVTC